MEGTELIPAEIIKLIVLQVSDAQTFINGVLSCKQVWRLFTYSEMVKQKEMYESIISIRRIRKHHWSKKEKDAFIIDIDFDETTKMYLGVVVEMLRGYRKPNKLVAGKWRMISYDTLNANHIYGYCKGYDIDSNKPMQLIRTTIPDKQYGFISKKEFDIISEKFYQKQCEESFSDLLRVRIPRFSKWKQTVSPEDWSDYARSRNVKKFREEFIMLVSGGSHQPFAVYAILEKKCITAFWIVEMSINPSEYLAS